jgi:electron transfer flavoprotein-quinone oxidoreductase
LAAETIIKAQKRNDFSAASLTDYRKALDESFIMQDLKHFRKVPGLMETPQIFNEYPMMADEILAGLFVVNGAPPVKMAKKVMSAVKHSGGLFSLGKLGLKAMGAM